MNSCLFKHLKGFHTKEDLCKLASAELYSRFSYLNVKIKAQFQLLFTESKRVHCDTSVLSPIRWKL